MTQKTLDKWESKIKDYYTEKYYSMMRFPSDAKEVLKQKLKTVSLRKGEIKEILNEIGRKTLPREITKDRILVLKKISIMTAYARIIMDWTFPLYMDLISQKIRYDPDILKKAMNHKLQEAKS